MAKLVGYTTHNGKETVYVNLDLVTKILPHEKSGSVLTFTDGSMVHVDAEAKTIADHANGR